MIKADELHEFRPQVRFPNGEGITLSTVQDAITECAANMGIPVAFKSDQVKSGGMFNSTVDDCIILYHPEHEKDYYRFCVRVKHQGKYAFVTINDIGHSKQIGKARVAEFSKEDRKGKDLSYKVGSILSSAVLAAGRNAQKLEEEQMYYQCISDIFDEIVS